MRKLKPCPFCGGEAELCYGPGLGTDSCRGYTLYASCNECGAKSPGLWQEKKPELNDQGWKDAANEWNSRPGEKELKQLWSCNLDIIGGELEAELAEARAEIERLVSEIENKQYTITCASEENQQLKESLAEARAEIEKQDTLLEKCLSLLKQLNRKRRNDRKSILFIREQDPNTLYQERRYADQPRNLPLKDWIKRLARVHRHNRPAAVQMFEARFGELAGSPMFKTFRYVAFMLRYQRTGFMFPIFMYQDLPVTQSNTGENP